MSACLTPPPRVFPENLRDAMAACDLLGSFYQGDYVRKLPQPPCFYYQPALSAVKKPNKIRCRYRSTNAHRFFAAETQHSITPSTDASQGCTSCHGSSSVVPTDLAVKAHAQCVAKVLIHTHVRAAPFGTSAMRSVHTPQHSNAANMVAPYLVTVAKRYFNVARRFNEPIHGFSVTQSGNLLLAGDLSAETVFLYHCKQTDSIFRFQRSLIDT